jgi:hypothetical protein
MIPRRPVVRKQSWRSLLPSDGEGVSVITKTRRHGVAARLQWDDFSGFLGGIPVVDGREESHPVLCADVSCRYELVGTFLVFDVVLDNRQWCTAAGAGEVGRGPEVLAPQVFANVAGELLAQASCRDALEAVDQSR